MSDEALLVTLRVADLRQLVQDAVIDALAEFRAGAAPQPELLSGAAMAARLGVSRTTMHRLRLDGCPAVRVGDVYRYRPAIVMAWLESRSMESCRARR
jgi:hypothetical protein